MRSKKKSLSQKNRKFAVSFRPAIFRYGMTNRFVKDCRVGRKKCALLAMTNLMGFAGKRNNFRNETFERRCGATPHKNERIKWKTFVFQIKRPDSVSLRGAQRRGNLKVKGMASRGEAREHETKRKPYYKKGICCVVSLLLSLFQGSVSFRPAIFRFGMTNRFV